jgi:hypothetical protein
MADTPPDTWQIISVRLPHVLLQRLDRYLDWSESHRRRKSSRNAAVREALGQWLEVQEQRAGFGEPQMQRQQFYTAYQSLTTGQDWVAIPQLRQRLPWPPERFDAIVEALRAEAQIELARAEAGDRSAPALHEGYQVYGQLYSRLRWRP